MKICDKAKLPDGTKIQLEDWKSDYPSIVTTLSIRAYPKAKNTGFYSWVKKGETFSLGISRGWKSDEEVRTAYLDLINGKRKLEDFAEQYWNWGKDQYYMGLKDEEEY